MSYQVWCPDLGQSVSDSLLFVAPDAAHAAELWAEAYDRGSGMRGGQEVHVVVRENWRAASDRAFALRGAVTHTYIATEVF